MLPNLTGTPMSATQGVWNQLGLAQNNQQQLDDEEMLKRKRKLMSAGSATDHPSITSWLFPGRTGAMV